MAQTPGGVNGLAIEEGSVGAGRILDENFIISTDQDGVVPGDRRTVNDNIVIAAGAHRIITEKEWILRGGGGQFV